MAVSHADTSAPPGGWTAPRAAYVHVPFCRHRCGYCNFSVIAGRDDLIERFLAAIDRELAALDRPEIDTLFVGGGTPTHLDEGQLDRLLTMLSERFRLADDVEWTIEANPEDIVDSKLDVLVEHGVNRISLGVQSFDDAKLRSLERSHSGSQARRVIEATAARIPNVSIDLIFAAPLETTKVWSADLDLALSLPVQHLSTYSLTYEKGTMFWGRKQRSQLQALDDAVELALYQSARERARLAGLEHYEISNFALAGRECRHNLAYWSGDTWYAAGPGAARFVEGRRAVNHRSPTSYLKRMESQRETTAECESISTEQFAREMAAFGIRLIRGLDLRRVETRSGIDARELCREAIARCVDDELVESRGQQLKLTERGILFADTVASRLLSQTQP